MLLVVVESPNKVQKIQRYLDLIEPGRYRVIATVGHWRGLPAMDGQPFEKVVDVNALNGERFVVLKKNVESRLRREISKASGVLLATDPDREGEAIAWHVAEHFSLGDPTRLTFHEITKAALARAVRERGRLNRGLIEAQRTRAVLDYLLGMELSRRLWRFGAKSAGRVQSCALRIVVTRELAIRAFTATPFWTVEAKYKEGLTASVVSLREVAERELDENEESDREARPTPKRFTALDEAEKLVRAGRDVPHVVESIDVRPVIRRPLPPFTTASLLAAGAGVGLSPDQVSAAAQRLFESGLVTYIRTDSVALSEEGLANIRDYIGVHHPALLPVEPQIFANKASVQGAHEAIRPTDMANPEAASLSGTDKVVYDLIWNRALCCQLRSAELERQVVTIRVEARAETGLQQEPAANRSASETIRVEARAETGSQQAPAANRSASETIRVEARAETGSQQAPAANRSASETIRVEAKAETGLQQEPAANRSASETTRVEAKAETGFQQSPSANRSASETIRVEAKAETGFQSAQPHPIGRIATIAPWGCSWRLVATGLTVVAPGFLAVARAGDADEEKRLPPLKVGERLTLCALAAKAGQTQAPKRFSIKTLIRYLERKGIGRPSTYAATVGVLLGRDYVQIEKGFLRPTELGETAEGLLRRGFDTLTQEGFTAMTERTLDEIEAGRASRVEFLRAFKKSIDGMLESAVKIFEEYARANPAADRDAVITAGVRCKEQPRWKPGYADAPPVIVKHKAPCPRCGGQMVVRRGRFGVFAACANRECDGRVNLTPPKIVRGPCPLCGGAVIEQPYAKNGVRRVFYRCTICEWRSSAKPGGYDARRSASEAVSQSGSIRSSHARRDDAPKCVACGATMQKRRGKHGEFWGCPRYPACKITRAVEPSRRRATG
jgi:DNA topoisomerase IA/ssDNA-binding Zn-finger/Zn-ribbon topoisomerase 1